MTGKAPPGPVPRAEYLVDWPIVEQVVGTKLPFSYDNKDLARATLDRPNRRELLETMVGLMLHFCEAVSMDYLPIELGTGFLTSVAVRVGAGDAATQRTWWLMDPNGAIGSWEDFERFSWPSQQDLDYTLLDIARQVVPDGMKILVQNDGLFDSVSCLMGKTRFFTALYDNPDLVNAVIDRVVDTLAGQVQVAVQYDEVGGIWMGDDLGFNTGTLISPDALRRDFFPGYRRMIEATHRAERVFLLHSCGNLGEIMEDFVCLGVDAKRSFEDKIMPVEEVHSRWGAEIGILGGVDMDLLARRSQEDVRIRTRQILDACGPYGRYALGTGNSVADYVPLENYLAMIDEGTKWNTEHYGDWH